MTELPVVFDVDGVLADFALHFTRLAHKHFPHIPARSAGAQFNWLFAHQDEEDETLWGFIKQATGWWHTVPMLATPGDVEAMYTLARPVVYMTSRVGRHPRTETAHWLGEHGFPVGKVVVTNDKVAGIKALGGCAAVIDDRPDNLEKLHRAGIWTVARDWPYNRHVTEVNDRVSSVAEFVEKVR